MLTSVILHIKIRPILVRSPGKGCSDGLNALQEQQLSEHRDPGVSHHCASPGYQGHNGHLPLIPVKKPPTPGLEMPRSMYCHRHWKPPAVLALVSFSHIQTNDSSGRRHEGPVTKHLYHIYLWLDSWPFSSKVFTNTKQNSYSLRTSYLWGAKKSTSGSLYAILLEEGASMCFLITFSGVR